MKTQAEVTALKANWIADPIWDIYQTEGFEDYRDELRRFQDEMEAVWQSKHQLNEALETVYFGK